MVSMNKLSRGKRARVIACLVEGCSIRSTVRMTGVAKNTVTKLLVDIGRACGEYQDLALRNLVCKRVQCDEIWSFCYAKDKNLPDHMRDKPDVGSIWTWVALDADSKLAVSWLVGDRDAGYAHEFMQDVAGRLEDRVQLTTDGLSVYLDAVADAFAKGVDYAMLIKIYGPTPAGEARYSPPKCNGARKVAIEGQPESRHVSTSYVERQNLTMRMNMRRFTRLTNAFSKKVDNLQAAVNLHFMYYNFVRIHKTLRMTPAMAAGVTDRLWEIDDIVGLLEEHERAAIESGAMKRGSYKKRDSD